MELHENDIGTVVVDSAIAVHRALGPGLLESVYELAMAAELRSRSFQVSRQVPIPITYKGLRLEEGFRADIIVNDKVILELKSVERISEAHKKQVQTYLRLAGRSLGYLLNYNVSLMRDGITRCVYRLDERK